MTEFYEQPLPIRTYDIDFAGIVSNIVFSMNPAIDASEALGFIMEAMTWLTTVLSALGGSIFLRTLVSAFTCLLFCLAAGFVAAFLNVFTFF